MRQILLHVEPDEKIFAALDDGILNDLEHINSSLTQGRPKESDSIFQISLDCTVPVVLLTREKVR